MPEPKDPTVKLTAWAETIVQPRDGGMRHVPRTGDICQARGCRHVFKQGEIAYYVTEFPETNHGHPPVCARHVGRPDA